MREVLPVSQRPRIVRKDLWGWVTKTLVYLPSAKLDFAPRKPGRRSPIRASIRSDSEPGPYTSAVAPVFAIASSLSSKSNPAVRALWLRAYQR